MFFLTCHPQLSSVARWPGSDRLPYVSRKEQRKFINAHIARIIQRSVEPAPTKAHISIKPHGRVVDSLCLNPQAACVPSPRRVYGGCDERISNTDPPSLTGHIQCCRTARRFQASIVMDAANVSRLCSAIWTIRGLRWRRLPVTIRLMDQSSTATSSSVTPLSVLSEANIRSVVNDVSSASSAGRSSGQRRSEVQSR